MATRKLELRQLYDKTAQSYDRRYEEIQRTKYRLIMENIPDDIKRVLDLGCGTGIFLGELASRCRFTVGVDLSLGMLRVANVRRKKAALVLADADHLPFADGRFDAVVSVTLLQNMPNPAETVKETARVLREGGVAFFTVLKRKHSRAELEEWVRLAGMRLTASGEIERSEDVFCVARR